MELNSLIEVRLGAPDDFLKIKETLTRIGVASKKEKTLYQSCHILHKRGQYFILHFKQLFLLDGKQADYSTDDMARLNTIVKLLEEWKLLTIVDKKQMEKPIADINTIKIIPYKEKEEWNLVSKYTVGKKRN